MIRKRGVKTATVSSTTSDDTVSSLNTIERKGNKESEGKMAGMSFNFAVEMQRKTLSRSELTQLIQSKFDEVTFNTQSWTNSVSVKMEMIMKKEEEIK